MLEQFMYIAFFGLTAGFVLTSLADFGRATIQDIKTIQKIKKLRGSKGQSKLLRARPPFDIIVYNYNNAGLVEKSLKSVLGQSYRKVNITVVDNNSNDHSLQAIKKLIKENPKKSIRLIAKTKKSSRRKAVMQAIKRYSSAERVLIMDAGCMLACDTLQLANRHFAQNNHTKVLLPNVQLRHNETISGLLQQACEHLSLSAKKALRFDKLLNRTQPVIFKRTFINSLNKDSLEAINDIGVLRCVLKKRGSLAWLAFNEMIVVYAHPLPYSEWLARRRQISSPGKIILFLQPLIITYMAYVAMAYQVYGYLLLAFFTFTVFLVLNILSDKSLQFPAKARAGVIVAPIYGAYIVDGLIAILSTPVYTLSRGK